MKTRARDTSTGPVMNVLPGLVLVAMLLWSGSYCALRMSGTLVRTGYVEVDDAGIVLNTRVWVQVGGSTRTSSSWAAALTYFPLWQLEFRARGVYTD